MFSWDLGPFVYALVLNVLVCHDRRFSTGRLNNISSKRCGIRAHTRHTLRIQSFNNGRVHKLSVDNIFGDTTCMVRICVFIYLGSGVRPAAAKRCDVGRTCKNLRPKPCRYFINYTQETYDKSYPDSSMWGPVDRRPAVRGGSIKK